MSSKLSNKFESDIEEILITEVQIKDKIIELGEALTEEYHDKNPVVVGILKGSLMFMADMLRKLQFPLQIDFMMASSYGESNESGGWLNIKKEIEADIKGRHVILVEDIIDTGLTMSKIIHFLKSKDPASVKLVSFLDKPEARVHDIQIDYIGFSIPNKFVVGYGLDYSERYRNLPYIGVIRESVWNKNLAQDGEFDE